VSILKFEYEAFSVGVKVRNPKENNTIKEYVIPEGFTIWIEIAFNQVLTPVSMF
jgi:hypothetical protein